MTTQTSETDKRFPSPKGQTTVDYVLVLGVVLVIGLLAVGLSGAWPDLALNSRNQQAIGFWRDQVRPITITEAHYDMSDKRLYLSLQTQVDERLELSGLYLENKQMAVYAYDPAGSHVLKCDLSGCSTLGCECDMPLNPRRSERIVTENFTAAGLDPGCTQSGTVSRLPISLTYYRPAEPSRNLTQNATVDLVFDCQS